ncbi:MAG: hypothetical protein ACOYK8_07350 [Alphaproteobacteria bacterium]
MSVTVQFNQVAVSVAIGAILGTSAAIITNSDASWAERASGRMGGSRFGTPAATSSPKATATPKPTATATPKATPTATFTPKPTPTATFTPKATPTATPTPTATTKPADNNKAGNTKIIPVPIIINGTNNSGIKSPARDSNVDSLTDTNTRSTPRPACITSNYNNQVFSATSLPNEIKRGSSFIKTGELATDDETTVLYTLSAYPENCDHRETFYTVPNALPNIAGTGECGKWRIIEHSDNEVLNPANPSQKLKISTCFDKVPAEYNDEERAEKESQERLGATIRDTLLGGGILGAGVGVNYWLWKRNKDRKKPSP